jgi:hypothetical protein
MIYSGSFLRKPPDIEIDLYIRFIRKSACRNHRFTVNRNMISTVSFLRNIKMKTVCKS